MRERADKRGRPAAPIGFADPPRRFNCCNSEARPSTCGFYGGTDYINSTQFLEVATASAEAASVEAVQVSDVAFAAEFERSDLKL